MLERRTASAGVLRTAARVVVGRVDRVLARASRVVVRRRMVVLCRWWWWCATLLGSLVGFRSW